MAIADRARCTPWEIEDAPSWWVDRVGLALMAENEARAESRRRDERQSRMRRMTRGHGGA